MNGLATARTGVPLALALASFLCLPFSADPGSCAGHEPTWTIMVYMAADTDPPLPWAEDINEMEAAAIPDWMSVVALVDPDGIGDSFVMEIQRDVGYNAEIVSTVVDDQGQVVPASGEADMAAWETLRDFVVFSGVNYPADRLVLVIWGHGGGWLGVCQDRLSIMPIPSLATALDSATGHLGRKLDMVVADACAQGVLETIYEIRDFADFFVGSERNVPAQGLRYDLALDSLARDRSLAPGDWGVHICETYRDAMHSESAAATMAVFDLAAVDEFVDRLVFYGRGASGFASLYGDELMGALLRTSSSDFSNWYLDVGDMFRRSMNASLPLETGHMALEALLAYDGLVYGFRSYANQFDQDYSSVVNSTGASVYLPSTGPVDGAYWSLALSDAGWADASAIMRSTTDSIPNGPAPEVLYDDTDGDGRNDFAVLQWAPGNDRYEAWVFVQTPSGMQLLHALESHEPNITLAGYAGELLVSASAWDGDSARSHHTISVSIAGKVKVTAKVVLGGEAVTDGMRAYVVSSHGRTELSPCETVFTGVLTITSDADYGELVTVEVRNRDGYLLADNRTYVQGSEVYLEIKLFGERTEELGRELIIPAAFLVVSALAITLYANSRGRGRGRE